MTSQEYQAMLDDLQNRIDDKARHTLAVIQGTLNCRGRDRYVGTKRECIPDGDILEAIAKEMAAYQVTYQETNTLLDVLFAEVLTPRQVEVLDGRT